MPVRNITQIIGITFLCIVSRVDIISYKPKRNFIAEHPLYNVYLWVSETLLRLGPIVTLTILNILIIVRYNRIARKREVLKGAAVHRTPTSKNGACGNNYRRSASPIMPVEGVNGGTTTTNGQFLTVANAQTTGEKISPTALSVTQVSLRYREGDYLLLLLRWLVFKIR